jgi:DNA-binding MarR family transcriptional regulator
MGEAVTRVHAVPCRGPGLDAPYPRAFGGRAERNQKLDAAPFLNDDSQSWIDVSRVRRHITYTYLMGSSIDCWRSMTAGKDIARGLKIAYALMHRQTQALLSHHDMTADQFVLLALLNLEDGVTQNELAHRAASDPNTIRAMLVLMEDNGLVIRKPHENDRRAHKVILTTAGRRLYAKVDKVLRPLQDALLAPFEKNEANRLVDYLRRIADAMRRWQSDRNASKPTAVNSE